MNAMLIRTMGLFWRREDVFWGKGGKGNKAKLLGLSVKAKRDEPIDFWEQVGVYALYADYELVYIGQAGTGKQRLGHRLRKRTRDHLSGRWDSFSWFGVCKVLANGLLPAPPTGRIADLPEILNILEGVAISVAEPALNRQGGRFGEAVEQYLQKRDQRLGPTPQEAVAEVLSQIKQVKSGLRDG